MSPASVVIVRLPPPTWYLAAFSRTIAFQRVLSRAVPEKSSSRDGPEGVPPPPGTLAPSRRNQSKSATGAVVAALLNANMPIFAPAGTGAGHPTGFHVVRSVDYAPVTLVRSETIRT